MNIYVLICQINFHLLIEKQSRIKTDMTTTRTIEEIVFLLAFYLLSRVIVYCNGSQNHVNAPRRRKRDLTWWIWRSGYHVRNLADSREGGESDVIKSGNRAHHFRLLASAIDSLTGDRVQKSTHSMEYPLIDQPETKLPHSDWPIERYSDGWIFERDPIARHTHVRYVW